MRLGTACGFACLFSLWGGTIFSRLLSCTSVCEPMLVLSLLDAFLLTTPHHCPSCCPSCCSCCCSDAEGPGCVARGEGGQRVVGADAA